MCNNFPNIKVVRGNAFALLMPLKKRTFESCEPIDEDIDATQLTDLVVKFGGVEYQASTSEDGVQIIIPADIAVGTYGIVLTAMYQGSAIRAAYESAVTIVDYNSQSDAQQYIAGSPIVLDAAYVIGGTLTDAELEALKEEYREKNAQLQQAIEDAEAAKAEWEQKAADLDGVAKESTSQDILTAVENIDIDTSDLAKESTLTQGVQDIRDDISHIDIDTSTLAKQGTNPNATLSDVQSKIDSTKTAVSALPTLQQMINAGMIHLNYDDIVYLQGTQLQDSFGVIVNRKRIVEVHSSDAILPMMTAADYPALSVLEMTGATDREGNGASWMTGSSTLSKVILPNITWPNMWNVMYNMTNLVYADFKDANLTAQGGVFCANCPNLIDLIYGTKADVGIGQRSVLQGWSPTTALLSNSQSLLTPEDIAAGFANNLEKLLYNIREHIAANLPDRTGQSALTLTMSAAVKAAINGDTATANAFANKNWIIA